MCVKKKFLFLSCCVVGFVDEAITKQVSVILQAFPVFQFVTAIPPSPLSQEQTALPPEASGYVLLIQCSYMYMLVHP